MACFSDDQIKGLWAYAKENYVDKGFTGSFDDLVGQIARDTGSLTKNEVATLLSKPKSARLPTKELYRRQYERSRVLRDAKSYTESLNESKASKAIKLVTYLPTFAKVMGHSTALMGTHAWRFVYQPKYWGTWLKAYGDSLRAISKTGAQDITNTILRDDNFTDWVKPQKYTTFTGKERSTGGLAVDPRQVYDDVQNYAHRIAGPLGRMTENSFLGLKMFRLNVANRIWESIPENLRTDRMRGIVQMSVNHSTGAVPEMRLPEIARIGAFAPGLEASRWQSLVVDPLRTIASVLPEKAVGNLASKEARYYAVRRAQGAASVVGVLAITGAIAKALTGKDQNMTDPQKPGFMWVNTGDKMISYTGGLGSTARFGYRMISPGTDSRGKPIERGDIFSKYVRGKLAPWAGLAADLVSGSDYMGKPLPGQKPTKREQPYTVPEYLTQQVGPLATAEAIKDLNEAGVPADQKLIRALQSLIIASSGGHSYTPDKH